ncbi:MipA/OmpV family protein [Aestuariibacter sp. A3R04]|uniref:MipA/OmpV family protein n=1 Tax=Aestuariibacter sp. A3R04 TaxID=2841571 RepID=UPI001C08CDD5|nr:MipA/OmpV family protein [Aestuariibacter sp. A3R04]MBU3020923.1 MipA/OmpV family protein [Aestuariibacter sp. A3R04]
MKRSLVFLYFIFVTFRGYADDTCEPDACVAADSFRFALAIGYGQRTNPLRNGDNQNLVLIGDFAWYGKAFYIDNLEIGYQWHEGNALSVNTYITYDREARPFHFFDGFDASPLDMFTASEIISSPGGVTSRISIESLARRNNGVHGGVRLNASHGDNVVRLAVEHDLANVHQGIKVQLTYRYRMKFADWLVSVGPQITWHDAAFNDYYYGISARDTADSRLWYTSSSGFRPGANFSLTKQLNSQWGVLFFARYQHLPSSLTRSPIVDQNHIRTVFAGLTYAF